MCVCVKEKIKKISKKKATVVCEIIEIYIHI